MAESLQFLDGRSYLRVEKRDQAIGRQVLKFSVEYQVNPRAEFLARLPDAVVLAI